jgi:hypothetical protein
MEQELQNRIEELESKLEQKDKEFLTFKKEYEEFKTKYTDHNHTGKDGTGIIRSSIDLKAGEPVFFNGGAIETVYLDGTEFLGLIVGNDREDQNDSDNTQFIIQHQPLTNGTTNQSFIYGDRKPRFQGSFASITSGGTTMRTNEFTFELDELVGAYIIVYRSASEFDVFQISSNTGNTVTITGGTWSTSVSPAKWVIFVPVYLGAAEIPWRRLYTTEGVAGGIRFGVGHTAGGQNGMLYMDAVGDLYWRNKAGSSTKLN